MAFELDFTHTDFTEFRLSYVIHLSPSHFHQHDKGGLSPSAYCAGTKSLIVRKGQQQAWDPGWLSPVANPAFREWSVTCQCLSDIRKRYWQNSGKKEPSEDGASQGGLHRPRPFKTPRHLSFVVSFCTNLIWQCELIKSKARSLAPCSWHIARVPFSFSKGFRKSFPLGREHSQPDIPRERAAFSAAVGSGRLASQPQLHMGQDGTFRAWCKEKHCSSVLITLSWTPRKVQSEIAKNQTP